MACVNFVQRAMRTSAAVLLTGTMVAGPAWAQPSAAPGAAPPMTQAPPASGSGTSSATVAPAGASHDIAAAHQPPTSEQVEHRITALHGRLHITAAEQPQWDVFAQAMRSNAAHMQQVFAQQPNTQNASALEDMRAYAAITQAQAQDMQNMLPAFEALYNSMTSAQKQEADGVFHQYARQRTAAERPARHG